MADLTGTADDDPWSPDRLVWALLDTIDASARPAVVRPTGRTSRLRQRGADADLRVGRRHAVARRVAALFASHAAQRPQLLAGGPTESTATGSAPRSIPTCTGSPNCGGADPRIPGDPPHLRHARVLGHAARRVPGYRPQLSLFGQTRLATTDIELLDALSTNHDVHLWIRTPARPCGSVWRMCAAGCPDLPTRTGVATPC